MYRYYVRKSILPYIGSFKMTTIKTMQIQEIFNKEYERGFAKGSLNIIKNKKRNLHEIPFTRKVQVALIALRPLCMYNKKDSI